MFFFKALAAIVTADAIDRHMREQQRRQREQRTASAYAPPGQLRPLDYFAPERPA